MFNVKTNACVHIGEEEEAEAPSHRRTRTWLTDVKLGQSLDQVDKSSSDTKVRNQIVVHRFEDDRHQPVVVGYRRQRCLGPVLVYMIARGLVITFSLSC